jgi:hypothetical protein
VYMTKTLRWPKHPEGAHVRTCQECGHTQVMKDPSEQKSENWREAKCRRCKSESLDFGTINAIVEDEW